MPVPAGYVLETPSSLPKGYVLDDAAAPPVSAPDFTKGKAGEGLYQMAGPDGSFTAIPYSNVMSAAGAGYRMKNDVREKYAGDRRAELLKGQPKTWDEGWFTDKVSPAEEALKTMELPDALPEKPGLWSRVESNVEKVTEPTNVFPGVPISATDPAAGEFGLNTIKRVGRVLFGVADMGPQAFSALKDTLSHDPQKAADGFQRFTEMINPTAQVVNRLKELRDDFHTDPKLAASNVTGDLVGLWLAGRAMEAPKGVLELRQEAERRYGPRNVTVAGANIPVAVGEAEPESAAGRKQIELKRRGVGAQKFTKLENEQQEAVKNVIRKTAQHVTGDNLTRGYPREPAAAMGNAAEATFDKARPIYTALDGQLQGRTANLTKASRITRQAIVRARRLGVVIGDAPAKPLTTYARVRSQLLKIQRSTTDAALRYTIGQEVKAMNKAMDSALAGTPLADNWKEADRLWAKGYALREVADEIRAATKGTPEAEQTPGLAPVPTKLQATSLVSRLNKLAESGTLEKAFTDKEAANLRQSADLLNRIQKVRVGKAEMEGLLHPRALHRALGGAKGPAIGAGVGFVLGGLHGAEAGAGLGFLLQHIGERALVGVMTRNDGVVALKALAAAKTAAQYQTAMKTLARVAAASSAAQQPANQPTKSLKQLQAEAEKRKPVAVRQ
jgi:hypothetical protein